MATECPVSVADPPTCEPHPHSPQSAVCPMCGMRGKAVTLQTVKAQAAISLRRLQLQPFWFCRSAACPVVYFSPVSGQTLTVDQVRERVYQKEPGCPDVLVCYCFQYRVGDIQLVSAAECAAVIADIKAGIAADQCACELRNPQGACCLGNVQRIAKQALSP
ncbi:MAG: hypothetical protein J7459_07125 [Chloroflexus sp.]|nr:hypothetical protein [Chloroflexus sp.]